MTGEQPPTRRTSTLVRRLRDLGWLLAGSAIDGFCDAARIDPARRAAAKLRAFDIVVGRSPVDPADTRGEHTP